MLGVHVIYRANWHVSHLSLVGKLQNVLAVANEEGIVRIYNTESRENPLLKGKCSDSFIHSYPIHRQGI